MDLSLNAASVTSGGITLDKLLQHSKAKVKNGDNKTSCRVVVGIKCDTNIKYLALYLSRHGGMPLLEKNRKKWLTRRGHETRKLSPRSHIVKELDN